MSESAKKERRTHFRGRSRPGRRVELELFVAADREAEPIRAFTRNIGVGGAFIATDRAFPPGTELRLVLHVPTSDRPIVVAAEVRWRSDGTTDEPGLGVKFHELGVDDLLALSEYFASLTGTEAAL